MSTSRSPTPTPSTPPTNTALPAESTTSRPDTHEDTPSLHSFQLREQPSPSHQNHPYALRPISDSSDRMAQARLSPEDQSDQQMAKRIRRGSPATSQHSGDAQRSSPSSDSQGDMADTETDVKPSQESETAAPPAAPPKKKRTRTLTTPHQSAVLHALLAKSRFPTTAMREEVGRSIGLSARKVQIWFQNQRQKARRPRSQSDSSRKRGQQYGPFPSGSDQTMGMSSFTMHMPQGSSSTLAYLSQPSGSGGAIDERFSAQQGYGAHPPAAEALPNTADQPSYLLGPGMPGAHVPRDIGYRERMEMATTPIRLPDPRPPISPERMQGNVHSPTPARPYASMPPRPTTTGRLHDPDPSRVLPPLSFGPPQTRASYTSQGIQGRYSSSLPSASPIFATPRSASPDTTRFAHQPPQEPASRSPTIIPPPFTMQPAPQWDQSAFSSSALLDHRRSAWSRPASRSTLPSVPSSASTSSLSLREPGPFSAESSPGERSGGGSASGVTSSPPRVGRYDPVRATSVSYRLSSGSILPPDEEPGSATTRRNDERETD